jgi:phosphatidyl-myo-inositol dimannoside synthase
VSRNKRILLLTHEFAPYPGGVGRYCWSLAAAAAREGHRVSVLAPTHGPAPADEARDPPGVQVERFAGDLFHFRQLRALERIVQQVLAREAWDVVHAADWPMIFAMRRFGTPRCEQIASLHGSDVLLLKHSLRARLGGAARALAQFDRHVCNSQYTASLLLKAFPQLSESHVRVAPLGVDAWWFQAPLDSELAALGRRVDRRPGERLILTVARLDPRKGHLSTLDALGRLDAREKAKLKYVCIGATMDESYRDKLIAKAQSVGIRTVLTGRVADAEVRAAYRAADVLALCGQHVPGKVEGFGLVLLEAAAQGLPAIVTRVQALPEVIQHQRTGWICDPDGIERLTDAFRECLARPADAGLHTACIEHARNFDWSRCAHDTYARGLAEAA